MKFNDEVWFWGPEMFGPRGRKRNLLLQKRVEIEMEPGRLNPPILSIDINGTERTFHFAANVGSATFYHEASLLKL